MEFDVISHKPRENIIGIMIMFGIKAILSFKLPMVLRVVSCKDVREMFEALAKIKAP